MCIYLCNQIFTQAKKYERMSFTYMRFTTAPADSRSRIYFDPANVCRRCVRFRYSKSHLFLLIPRVGFVKITEITIMFMNNFYS